jgi:DAACS family dicarboxylate/amino acid:cation (Na+ or H+) symporter
MLIGISVGAAGGLTANVLFRGSPQLAGLLEYFVVPVGQIFLRLLFMLVVPMLFSAIVLGISGLELSKLGRMGLKTLGYTVVVSTIAVVIGLTLVNLSRPGDGLS